jgi:hypothetical protein
MALEDGQRTRAGQVTRGLPLPAPTAAYEARSSRTPTCTVQWATVVSDSQVGPDWMALIEHLDLALSLLADLASKPSRQEFRQALIDAARTADRMARSASHVGWFRPLDDGGGRAADAQRAARAAQQVVPALLSALASEGERQVACDAVDVHLHTGSSAVEAFLRPPPPWRTGTDEDDLLRLFFGATMADVGPGALTGGSARLIARAGKSVQVSARSLYAALGHLLPVDAHDVPAPTGHPALVLTTPRPLSAHRAALLARGSVEDAFKRSREGCVRAIVEAMHQESDVATTHRTLVNARNGQSQVVAGDDAGLLALLTQQYLAAAEGLCGYMGRTVLRLHGIAVPENETLAPLLQRLQVLADPLANLLVEHVDVDWRNGVAHSQVRWDPTRQAAVIRGLTVSLGELKARADALFSLWHGFELGVAIAKHADTALRDSINRTAQPWDRGVILEVLASQVCAWHGLDVREVRRRGDAVTIVLSSDRPNDAAAARSAVDEVRPSTPNIRRWVLQRAEAPEVVLIDEA